MAPPRNDGAGPLPPIIQSVRLINTFLVVNLMFLFVSLTTDVNDKKKRVKIRREDSRAGGVLWEASDLVHLSLWSLGLPLSNVAVGIFTQSSGVSGYDLHSKHPASQWNDGHSVSGSCARSLSACQCALNVDGDSWITGILSRSL